MVSIKSPATEKPWAETFMKRWFGTQLAHKAANVNQLYEQGRLVRQLVRKTQQGTLGQVSEGDIEGEDMIHVGDVTVNQTAPVASAAVTPMWQKALASVALVAGGAGIGGGIPWLLGAFERPAVEQTAPVFTDADTQYRLSILPESE